MRAFLVVLALLLLAAPPAHAAKFLTKSQRADIVRTGKVRAPSGRVVRQATCIGGILSTVDRRFAAVWLANTSACLKRYGAPGTGAALYRRASRNARRWRATGSRISDTCRRVKGVPNAVLSDLGCTRIEG